MEITIDRLKEWWRVATLYCRYTEIYFSATTLTATVSF